MRPMIRLAVAAVGLFFYAAPSLALELVIDDRDPGFTTTGSWTQTGSSDVGRYAVYGDEAYTFTLTNTATWTPSGAAGFVPGTYNLQVTWYAWNHATNFHSPQAQYTVNHTGGSTAFVVDQSDIAAQSNPGSLSGPPQSKGYGSGWYTLGQFELDAASTVVLSNAGTNGALSADALRISDAGRIIDEYSANTAYSAPGPSYSSDYPSEFNANTYHESTQYAIVDRGSGSGTATYTTGMTGPTHLWLSWAVHPNHTAAADYTITDAAGRQHTVTVDQGKYADQATSHGYTKADWSGWYDAGYYDLGPSSTVQLSQAPGANALVADALRVQQADDYAGRVLADRPVGYWRFDEAAGATTAINLGTAGSQLDATYRPSKIDTAGLIKHDPNGAVELNGSNTDLAGTGLDTATATGGNPFDGDWSIEVWMVRDSAQPWTGIFTTNGNSSQYHGPLLTFFDERSGKTRHHLGMNDSGGSADGISVDLSQYGNDTEDYLGERIYAVLTKEGGNQAGTNTVNMYVNVGGQWLPTATGSTFWDLQTRDIFYMGRHYTVVNQIFDGTLDELAIYDYALSWGQIQSHYALGSVPEPGSAALALLAVLGLCFGRRRKR